MFPRRRVGPAGLCAARGAGPGAAPMGGAGQGLGAGPGGRGRADGGAFCSQKVSGVDTRSARPLVSVGALQESLAAVWALAGGGAGGLGEETPPGGLSARAAPSAEDVPLTPRIETGSP